MNFTGPDGAIYNLDDLPPYMSALGRIIVYRVRRKKSFLYLRTSGNLPSSAADWDELSGERPRVEDRKTQK
jgi:hypothetical protein